MVSLPPFQSYDQIVRDRKCCQKCMPDTPRPRITIRGDGTVDAAITFSQEAIMPLMVNPSATNLDMKNELGPWTRWQGKQDSPILVVGQDFSDLHTFAKYHGQAEWDGTTNLKLVQAFSHAGISLANPPNPASGLSGLNEDRLFFTNAVLCLKLASMSAAVNPDCYKRCEPFLAKTIGFLGPSLHVIVSLGLPASLSVLRIAGRNDLVRGATMKSLLRELEGLRVFEKGNGDYVYLWAFKHPAARGSLDVDRWKRFGNWLR